MYSSVFVNDCPAADEGQVEPDSVHTVAGKTLANNSSQCSKDGVVVDLEDCCQMTLCNTVRFVW